MKRIVSERVIQLTWFLAGVFATGAIWYFLSRDDLLSAGMSFAAAVILGCLAFYLSGLNNNEARYRRQREQLGVFVTEAQALSIHENDDPPPIQAHNDWVTRVEAYLRRELDGSYAVRFGDFNGLTFYLSNPNMGFKKSLQGRSRRLHEFIEELARK